MTTTSPPRPTLSPPPRAVPVSQAPGSAASGVQIDPVKLIKQYWPWLTVALIVGAVAGGAAHFALMRYHPQYRSTVVYECLPPLGDPTATTPSSQSRDEMDRFIGTQAAVMTSESILLAVARDPEVQRTEWAKQYVRNGGYQHQVAGVRLADHVSARPQSQTFLIQLSMTWKNPTDVATIVNAIDRQYRDELKKQSRLETSERRQSLLQQLTSVQASVERTKKLREDLLRRDSIDSLNAQNAKESLLVDNLQRQIAELNSQIASLDSMLRSYEQQLQANTVPDDIRQRAMRDPLIQSMENRIADLRSEERALFEQGYKSSHSAIQRIQTMIRGAEQERADRVERSIRDLFDGEIAQLRGVLQSRLSQLKGAEEQLRQTSERRTEITRTLVQVDQLKLDLDRLLNEEEKLKAALADLDMMERMDRSTRVAVRATGRIPDSPVFPKIHILVPLGAVLAVFAVGGLLVLREVLDQRVRGPADLAMLPRTSILGLIPQASEDPSRPPAVETAFRDRPTGVIAESFRQIRAPLAKRMVQGGHKTLLVLGGTPESGATTVVTNLAFSAAAADARVLVIDANLRRPAVHEIFGLPEGPGLGDVLAATSTLGEAVRKTSVANLNVLTAGSSAGRALPERLGTDAMARILKDAGEAYDLVLIDSAPAVVAGDGISLANRCDAVVLVVRAMAEKRGLVARVRNQLSDAHGDFLGVIVNAVRASAGGYFRRNIKQTHEYRKEHA